MTTSPLDRALSALLTAAAVVIAVSIGYRTFRDEPRPNPASRETIQVRGWEEATKIGVRIGPEKPIIEIVEIADLECPVCRKFFKEHESVFRKNADAVTVTHLIYPLSYHPNALNAAKGAECALRVGRFREWMGAVYANQDLLGTKSWGSFAVDAGIGDTTSFVLCLRQEGSGARAKDVVAFGDRIEFPGTPTYIINGWQLSRPPTAIELQAIIDQLKRGEKPFEKPPWSRAGKS